MIDIDIDKYLRQTITIKIQGKEVGIMQPTAELTQRIAEIEEKALKSKNTSEGLNYGMEITLLILNNNDKNIEFTMEDVKKIPFKLQNIIKEKIRDMVYEINNDPN